MSDRNDATFAQASPMLMGLAYRMLGSRADAEDAVQDTFIKWQKADKGAIDNPAAWLTAICTRRCIDLLRSAHRSRVDYVGAWLPEPIQTASETMSDETPELASSLTTAFLLMLERLTPKERATYLLHEIFDVDYPAIATALGLQEATCRKLVSRARNNIDQARVRHATPVERQEQLLSAFHGAIVSGKTGQLAALLSDDIEMVADGGGKVPAIRKALRGKADVLRFIESGLHQWWSAHEWVASDLNGGRGAVLVEDGVTVATVSLAFDETGNAIGIYIMRNPDKLSGLSGSAIA